MTTPNKLNEFNHAEDPARRLLERLGWTYVPAEHLAPERATDAMCSSRTGYGRPYCGSTMG